MKNEPVFQSTQLRLSTFVRSSLLKLWRTAGLNGAFNAGLPLIPGQFRRRLEEERERIRAADLQSCIRSRGRLVPENDLRLFLVQSLRSLAERRPHEPLGDYLEFGVYNGTSLTVMYRALQDLGLSDVRLFGFDSFQGFPPHAAHEDAGRWRPGGCSSSLPFTRAVLNSEGVDESRITLVPGWFEDTLIDETQKRYRIKKASVIMIDCDLYSSAKLALNFCAPLIYDEALILFDEYFLTGYEDKNMGEKRAFDEFIQESGCFTSEPCGGYGPSTQAFLVSRTR